MQLFNILELCAILLFAFEHRSYRWLTLVQSFDQKRELIFEKFLNLISLFILTLDMLVISFQHFVQMWSLLQNKGILSLDMGVLLVADGPNLINSGLLVLNFLLNSFFTFADFINFLKVVVS